MASPINKAQPTAGATTQVVTGGGMLHRVIVQAAAAVTCDVYDNTSTTGTPIFSIPASAVVGTVYTLDLPFSTGLRVVAGAALQLTLTYTNG